MRIHLDKGNLFALGGGKKTNDGVAVLRCIDTGLPEPIILVAFLAIKTLQLLAEILNRILATLLKICKTHV
jgi:hypothetical protein